MRRPQDFFQGLADFYRILAHIRNSPVTVSLTALERCETEPSKISAIAPVGLTGSSRYHILEYGLPGTCDPFASAEGKGPSQRTAGSSLTFGLTSWPAPATSLWREWRTILEQNSVDRIIAVMTAKTQKATELRQASPFAGALTSDEIARTVQLEKELRHAAEQDPTRQVPGSEHRPVYRD